MSNWETSELLELRDSLEEYRIIGDLDDEHQARLEVSLAWVENHLAHRLGGLPMTIVELHPTEEEVT